MTEKEEASALKIQSLLKMQSLQRDKIKSLLKIQSLQRDMTARKLAAAHSMISNRGALLEGPTAEAFSLSPDLPANSLPDEGPTAEEFPLSFQRRQSQESIVMGYFYPERCKSGPIYP